MVSQAASLMRLAQKGFSCERLWDCGLLQVVLHRVQGIHALIGDLLRILPG